MHFHQLANSLLDGLLDAVVTIDFAGRILYVNAAFCGMFGYASEEVLGHNVRLLMPEPHRSAHDGHLRRYRETGKTTILGRRRTFPALRKDGSPFAVEISIARLDGLLEQPVFVGTLRDVTERERLVGALAEGARRLRAIFDQEFCYVALLSPDGRVLDVNRSLLELAGAVRDAAVGGDYVATLWPGVTATTAARMRTALGCVAGGRLDRFEFEFASREKVRHVVDLSFKPILGEDGEVEFLITEGRDLTHLRLFQERERAMLRSLAEIGESASLLAHEIKEPITATHLALRAVASKLGGDERAALEELVTRLRKLEATMRRTLSFARPLDLELAMVELPELVARALGELRAESDARGAKIECVFAPGLPQVTVDAQYVTEAITNLVRNAIEAIATGGRIRITCSRGAADTVAVAVEDDGPGISPVVRAGLFQPFVSGKQSGTGLGLALCRKIVRQHGGAIDAADGALGGARFTMTLPISCATPTTFEPGDEGGSA